MDNNKFEVQVGAAKEKQVIELSEAQLGLVGGGGSDGTHNLGSMDGIDGTHN